MMVDLGMLGGTFSVATGIDDNGAVTGFSYLTGNAYAHAFISEGAVMRDLQTLGGLNSFSYGINNAGQAVGSSEIAGGHALHAFLYSDGEMLDLNNLLEPGFDWVLNYAADINERGQIAAFGCHALSQCQGFLLTPQRSTGVAEPASPAIILLGLGVLALARRRSWPGC